MNRRQYFVMILSCIICSFLPTSDSRGSEPPLSGLFLFVGTYTDGAGEGIYVYRLDANTGKLTSTAQSIETANPSYLTISPDNRFLYAVNQLARFQGKPGGAVSAFSIDSETGSLSLINRQPNSGAGPCHVAMDPEGKWVLTANYNGGSVTLFPVERNGHIGPLTDLVHHKGKSVHPKRQEAPHPHSVVFSPDGKYLFTPDLGIDKIVGYTLHRGLGKLAENPDTSFKTYPGAGPRHLVFHPNGSFAFLISELNSTITSLRFNPESGAFTEIQTVNALPSGFTGENKSADIHVSPSGIFLYGSNRGHNSIVIYKIDPVSGRLTFVDCTPCAGETPRNFVIDPTGNILLVANQDSDTIVSFFIDASSGKLKPTGYTAKIPAPVCLKFLN